MTPCKRLDLRGWKLLKTERWLFGLVRFKAGKLDTLIEREQRLTTEQRQSILGPNENQRIVIKSYRRKFGEEILLACFIYFFGRRQPVIQLWKNCDRPNCDHLYSNCLRDETVNVYEFRNPWWQGIFERAVRVDGRWWHLEADEYFSLPSFHIDSHHNIVSINLLVKRWPDEEENIIASTIIK